MKTCGHDHTGNGCNKDRGNTKILGSRFPLCAVLTYQHYGFSNNVGSRFPFIAVITYRHLGLTKNLGSKSPFCAAHIYRYHGLILRLDLIEYFLDRIIPTAEHGCLVGSLCHLTLCRRDRLCNLLAFICLKFPQILYQSPYVDAAS